MIKGKVHSFQSLGTVDGPGIRFVVFMQGCNLRCHCCHNPDTWHINAGEVYTPEDILKKVTRFKEYFGSKGGITLSGGEPLMQPIFAKKLFELCHKEGINTCLDTSGDILNQEVKELLDETDRILLDIKYTTDEDYKTYVGCSINKPLEFLSFVNSKNIPVTIRQVIIPTINDNEENIKKLKKIVDAHSCVDKIELLPFKKICQIKYDNMKLTFPFSYIPEPENETMNKLNGLLKSTF